jgi:hypothetical protein
MASKTGATPMKSFLHCTITLSATVLLLVVLALWAVSYGQALYVGHRDTTWTPGVLANRSAGVVIAQGRFGFLAGRSTTPMDIFFPERWERLSPDYQQRFHEMYQNPQQVRDAFRKFKTETRNDEFHGWDYHTGGVSDQPLRTTLYDSAFGWTYSRPNAGDAGSGLSIHIPAWILAALLALPGARWLHRRRAKSPRTTPPFTNPAAAAA